MKLKMARKIIALSLVLVLLFTSAASAITFNDISNHWAKEYIERVAENGLVQGYSNGTFKPDGNVTVLEALVMISRLYKIDEETRNNIKIKYKPILENMDNTLYREWSFDSLSVIMALDIVSENGIKNMFTKNERGVVPIGQPASKEVIAILLAKAMMLEDEAESLKVYPLPFNDVSQISIDARPYIYLLYQNEILFGDTKKNINPKDNISRAVISTMIDRTYKYINNNKVVPDLSAYDNGTELSGEVTKVSIGSTESSIYVKTGETTTIIKTNSDTKIYLNGQSAKISDIENNMFITCFIDIEKTARTIKADSLINKVNGIISYVAFTPPAQITIIDENETKKTYDVAETAAVYLNGKATALKNLLKDDLITVLVKDGVVTEIKSTSKTLSYEGTITNIDYSSYPVKITFKTNAGKTMTFEYSSSIDITRNSNNASFDEVKTGDNVSVTADYGKMTKLNIIAKEAIQSGIIKAITIAPQSKIKIEDNSGNIKEYFVGKSAKIYVDGNMGTVYDLRLGYKADISTLDYEIVTLDAENFETVINISGKSIYINSDEKVLMMQNIKPNGITEPVYLKITNSTKIFNTNGETKYINDILEGKNLICTAVLQNGENIAVSILIQ